MHLFESTTFIASFLLTLCPHALAAAIDSSSDSPPSANLPSLNLSSPPTINLHVPNPPPDVLPINCHGGHSCLKGPLDSLIIMATNAKGACATKSGQPLLCDGSFCAFTQDTKSRLSPESAFYLLRNLKAHGCQGCGSVSLNFPYDDDLSNGFMTVEFINDTKSCYGHCGNNCWSILFFSFSGIEEARGILLFG